MAGESVRWDSIFLEELADPESKAIVSGPFGSNISSKFFVEEGVPVIRGKNLSLQMERFIDEGFVFITSEKAKELGNVDAVCDDIIFTAAGTIGQIGLMPSDSRFPIYVISNKQIRVRLNKALVIPVFVYYCLANPQMVAHIQRLNTGSTVPLINLSIVKKLKVPLPPLAEQKAIAHILGTLDDKIELNRRMNETLEEMARTLFKSWFVDFDPVRAKLDGRQPAGMDAETAALFPAEFQDSELGKIPKGWEVKRLDDEFNITMGQSPPGKTLNEDMEGVPFYQGKRDFGFRFPQRRVYCTEPKRFANEGDTLVSVRAPVGSLNWANEKICIGRGVGAIRHENGFCSFTYYLMQSLGPHFDNFNGEGTVFGSINKKDFQGIQYCHSNSRLVNSFETIASKWDKLISVNSRNISSLASLRDTLLPKLLSGELRIKDAEKFMENAL